jgi:catechol 2,3-dioxygenase-like lactoylglutathione lyase family enzyme
VSSQEVRNNDAASSAIVASVDMKLEVVVIPVSDVNRAKEFCSKLGWRLDADRATGNGFRLIQFTPSRFRKLHSIRLKPHVRDTRFGPGPAPRSLKIGALPPHITLHCKPARWPSHARDTESAAFPDIIG